ncbi:unnamed protein product [marine sediment metagenome]|uniref:Uncharacterized protein n=1 Tax=marine sediment metagenome TaxID=412755 RepID=X1S005_9ZZZZ
MNNGIETGLKARQQIVLISQTVLGENKSKLELGLGKGEG